MTEIKPSNLLLSARAELPAITSFLQDLVRTPSVNGRDSETAVAERILKEASRLNLPASLISLNPDRPNALVKWGSGERGFTLVGHMDTVSEGVLGAWDVPPFSAAITDGKVIGRGSADNKAGIACGLYAIALVRNLGLLNPAHVFLALAGVSDEESGASSKLGMRHLINLGHLDGSIGAIYTYASDIICLGHRGLLRLLLRASGKTTHTGLPSWSQKIGGVNAVTGLAAILLRLEKLQIDAPSHPSFPGMNCTLTPGTLFRGGEFESMVPAAAEALIDIRLMPGQDADQVVKIVQEAINAECADRTGLNVEIQIKNSLPGVALPGEHPLVKSAEAWTAAITGAPWPVAGAGPANEGYMLMNAGIPTLCGFGPNGGGYHAPNEWVSVDSLAATTAMYTGIMLDTLNA